MELSVFMSSLENSHPPANSSVYLQALWYDRKGNWKAAHDLVDSLPGRDAARVHAYLHRVEGDEWNAEYWYSRAAATKPGYGLEQEWEELVRHYLQ
ncbi:MAG TPA: hypothetical protein VM802_07240 [Chitinophaga sp.]|uniref:hypothetical protein n=1 Tax=Chitinophaga sp. TaxID=1869181 RepID=UPI002CDFB235|nr:hypothetical protein [Chitinophaga sp.]HVI44645.1 hypothetical protein [Chitinophaga sp.]